MRLARVSSEAPRMAAVGHVEWVQFAHVERVPRAGAVVHARDPFEEPAGGGAVAAVVLARLAAGALLITALGRDEYGERSLARLQELGVEVRAERLAEPTRRALTLLDDDGERTITTLGPRLEPHGASTELGLGTQGPLDGVYFTAGDAAALEAARAAASVLVASPRSGAALDAGVRLDALVYSEEDEIERAAVQRAEPDAALIVITEGERGGHFRAEDGESGRWHAEPLPGPACDTYGCGDSFAAGLTYGLASGLDRARALQLAARCGASCVASRGPYGRN